MLPSSMALPSGIERISPDIDERTFFERFVAARQPCLIDGLPTEPGWKVRRWTDGYLAAAAGSETVHVEIRKGGGFGHGCKVRMPFGEFVRRAAAGDDRLYVSAQPLPEGDDGPTELHAAPLHGRLARDVPVRPRLLGNLVPQQINVWMGSSRNPTSSGLHHDFHDNLYVLLRGRKHFCLYPPSCALRMSTAGAIEQVHSNGLISYANMPTRADGLAREFERAAPRARVTAGGMGAADGAAARLEAAEAALEAARASGASAHVLRACEHAVAAAEEAVDAAMDSALESGPAFGEDGGGWDGCEEEASGDEAEGESEGEEGGGMAARLPDNFCAAPAPADLQPLEVELAAGQMLYLPASWFHEVRSCDAPDGETAAARAPNGAGHAPAGQRRGAAASSGRLRRGIGHFALNYWMHPPDTRSFDRPYADDHWQRRFDSLFGGRVEAGQSGLAVRSAATAATRRPRRLAACARQTVHPLRRRRLVRSLLRGHPYRLG